MALIAIVALDFAALRSLSDLGNGTPYPIPCVIDAFITGALPMVNVVAVGVLLARQDSGRISFILGFETFGATALVLYIGCVSMFPEDLLVPFFKRVIWPLAHTLGQRPYPRTAGYPLILYSIAPILFFLPQLAFALIGGCLFRRFRIAERLDLTRD
jgi:hypothetical protein